jgi:hypothetical protein
MGCRSVEACIKKKGGKMRWEAIGIAIDYTPFSVSY